MSIGEQIRKIRTQQKLTVKTLSELSNVPEKTIYRIETGEVQDPKLSSVEPIIKALNCSADEIIFSHDDFYKLGDLRQAFALATKLNEVDQDMLIRLIQKVSLASSIEKQISESKFTKVS
ncbi:MAG: helix-turn-helix transcriptional regulator [Flavobacteriaceae bacterium]|nr:helix-turn-helix transcriptional regulator [Flavobacteriaceae bacterium]